MARICEQGEKTCEVTWRIDPETGPYAAYGPDDEIRLELPAHNQTLITTRRPYVGPLCEHERHFLAGRPGKDFHAAWRFDVKVEGVLQRIFGRREPQDQEED
jgi:hypothetical protein